MRTAEKFRKNDRRQAAGSMLLSSAKLHPVVSGNNSVFLLSKTTLLTPLSFALKSLFKLQLVNDKKMSVDFNQTRLLCLLL